MNLPYIHSRQNEQVKNLVRLHERKHRDRQSRFLVEGQREIFHAKKAGFEFEKLFVSPELFPSESCQSLLEEICEKESVESIRLAVDVFNKVSFRKGPDGMIAVAKAHANDLSDLKISQSMFLLILEGIEKPGNLGALLRSADGAGVDAVILVDCVLDLYNPNAIRSSQGLVFSKQVISTDRERLTSWLKDHSVRTIATTPRAQNLHYEANFSGRSALLLGSESDGLTEYWLETCDQSIRIPMRGDADSLNVSVAAAVCMYEADRQRRSGDDI